MSQKKATVHPFFLPKVSKQSQQRSFADDRPEMGGLDMHMTLSELAAEDTSEKTKYPRLLHPRVIKVDIPYPAGSIGENDGGESDTLQFQNTSTCSETKPESPAPPITITPTSKPLLQQLEARSTTAIRRLTPKTYPEWSRCPWIHLACPTPPTTMAFDNDGVLLAVATKGNNNVQIWDWDTVIASDFQGRIDRKSDVVPPIIVMAVPHNTVSDLRWNKDSLAVSFRGTSHIYVYDMLIVSEEPSNPSGACAKLEPPSHMIAPHQGPKCVSFLPDYHLVASYPCGHVCLWNTTTSVSLIWVWRNTESISCALPIASNLILLGGIEGSFVVLDWKKTTRKAFATDKTPIILSSWKTEPLLRKRFPTVPLCDWGVQTMQLDMNSSRIPTNAVLDTIGPCRLSWITSGGWALSMDPSRGTKTFPKVHRTPPETKTLSSEGIQVSTATNKFSSPSVPVISTSSPDSCARALFVWQMVPQVTHILPHHDNRVCQQRQVRIDRKLRLACMTTGPNVNNNNTICSVGTTARVYQEIDLKSRATAIAIHCSNEWMILATESSSKLLVFNARMPPPSRACTVEVLKEI